MDEFRPRPAVLARGDGPAGHCEDRADTRGLFEMSDEREPDLAGGTCDGDFQPGGRFSGRTHFVLPLVLPHVCPVIVWSVAPAGGSPRGALGRGRYAGRRGGAVSARA